MHLPRPPLPEGKGTDARELHLLTVKRGLFSLPGRERPQGGPEAGHATRPPLPEGLLHQLALRRRVHPPKGALAWLFLGAWHFDEVTVQREVVAN